MVTLVILDGFGISKQSKGNAIKIQGTPNLNKLKYPTAVLQASSEAVGLNAGQMGNSEVGHLNLGAGRIVYQDLPKISKSIQDGDFFTNPAFLKVISHVKNNQSALHLMGLLSDGGVHSHINHLKALVDMAHKSGIEEIYIHCVLDGRDTLKNSAKGFIADIEKYIKGKAQIATICGRVYAMDRENRWDRIEKAYDMLMLGRAEKFSYSAQQAIEDSYKENVFDEFVVPTIIGKAKTVNSFDGFIFFNFRTDRARELTQAISQKDFNKFQTKKIQNLMYCCMTEYSEDFKDILVAFPPEKIEDNLSAIISREGRAQFHISETTKYAHVTFFFNGGIETKNPQEDRQLIESENVTDFASVPQMKAYDITESVIEAIAGKKYDFILVNLSNADMIGHTGNLDAAVKAIEVVDKCAYAIALATLMAGGDCIITADHGNAEEMIDNKGNTLTQHTTNPVPFWLVSEKYKNVKLKNGKLCNVAPTVLKLLEINIPDYMEKPLF